MRTRGKEKKVRVMPISTFQCLSYVDELPGQKLK